MKASLRAGALALLFALTLWSASAAVASNDRFFSQQWALARIEAEPSWSTSTGRNIVVAVVDTGVDFSHPDLAGKEAGSFNCIDDPCRPGRGDDHGHGTIVSGVIAANTNDSRGIAGAAPDAKILAIKVLASNGRGTIDDVAKGVRQATASGANVINLSLGEDLAVVGDATSGASYASAINEAWNKGIVVIAASGNSSSLISGYAGAQNLVVVGATGPDDSIASYSSGSSGVDVDIYAPGGDTSSSCTPERCILSTTRGGGYVYVIGTSVATPHVSAVAAQLVCLGRSNRATVDRMIQTSDRPGGVARVNANRAVGAPDGPRCAAAFPAAASGTQMAPSQPRSQPSARSTPGQRAPAAVQTSAVPSPVAVPSALSSEAPLPTHTVAAASARRGKMNPVVNLVIVAILGLLVVAYIIWSRLKSRNL